MRHLYTYIFLMALTLSLAGCRNSADSHEGHDHERSHDHQHEGEAEEIELSASQMKTVGITLGTMETRRMSEIVNATGELAVSSLSDGVITPRLGGILTRVLIKEGDRVSAGQTVAYMQSAELAPLQQEYMTAVAEENAAKGEYERQKALADHGAGIKKNLDQALSALKIAQARTEGIRKRLLPYGIDPAKDPDFINNLPIKSEVSGTVVKMNLSKGAYADVQTPIAQIVDNSGIFCILNIFEKDLPLIKSGLQVDLKLTNSPSEVFLGKVVEIFDTFDTVTKTVPVKVTISGATGRLIPGMAVSAVINTGNDSAEALPEEAVVSSGDKKYIFVLEDIHKEGGEEKYCFTKKEVITGARELGYVEIRPVDEIAPDAKIVVTNAFYLNSMASDHGEHSH